MLPNSLLKSASPPNISAINLQLIEPTSGEGAKSSAVARRRLAALGARVRQGGLCRHAGSVQLHAGPP